MIKKLLTCAVLVGCGDNSYESLFPPVVETTTLVSGGQPSHAVADTGTGGAPLASGGSPGTGGSPAAGADAGLPGTGGVAPIKPALPMGSGAVNNLCCHLSDGTLLSCSEPTGWSCTGNWCGIVGGCAPGMACATFTVTLGQIVSSGGRIETCSAESR